MTIEELKNAKKDKKLTLQQISEKSGIPKRTVDDIFSGHTKNPRLDTIQAIASALGIEEGEKPQRPSYEYSPTEGVVPLKIVGTISAGYNGEAVEEILGEQNFLASALRGYPPEECFLLQVKGNSMYPDYQDKDIVLVHRQTSVDSGNVAVILYNGNAATLKKVVYKNNEEWLELIPKNPEYPIKRIEGTDLQECQVLGKVVCIVFAER